ncbi:hypothetical protein TNCV_673951 [Trichonephila clavipes]|uniref:Uncharacterized protein n=1 Tax=Trichonephila clavipes TaxID=2585209 RepID=A0A8X7BIM7_TRICX|nr:hypothetical protein TNCV_673951 [Trichonephila clavipes]
MNSNSTAQQPTSARVYCSRTSIRDHWALRCISRCPDQVVSLKRDSQCLSPQASLVLICRPTAGVLPENWDETEPNRTAAYMVLKATANDRHTSSPCHDEFLGPQTDTVRLID